MATLKNYLKYFIGDVNMFGRKRSILFVLCAFGLSTYSSMGQADDPLQPLQPAAGPGGGGYLWSGMSYEETPQKPTWWNRNHDYWVFTPTGWTGPGLEPSSVPLIVFLHGYSTNPDPEEYDYLEIIEHHVRKGNIVVFPRFQRTFTPSANWTDNAIFSVEHAIDSYLPSHDVVQLDSDPGMQIIGYSIGGAVSINMAAEVSRAIQAEESTDIPQPRAVVSVVPAACNVGDNIDFISPEDDLEKIPADTKFVCIVGDQDTDTGREGCDRIWGRLDHIPDSNKNYIWSFGDAYGVPPMLADHTAGGNTKEAEGSTTMAFYGHLKIAEGLRDCAYDGINCEYSLGNTPEQTFMGLWSDGVPVRELQATTVAPSCCPAGSLAKGCEAEPDTVCGAEMDPFPTCP